MCVANVEIFQLSGRQGSLLWPVTIHNSYSCVFLSFECRGDVLSVCVSYEPSGSYREVTVSVCKAQGPDVSPQGVSLCTPSDAHRCLSHQQKIAHS